MNTSSYLLTPSENTSQELLVKQLRAHLLVLRQRNPASIGLPQLSCAEAREIGQTLMQIRGLSTWGEFTALLPKIGLTQPEASITRRVARDWQLIKARGYDKFRAAVAYQKLVQDQRSSA